MAVVLCFNGCLLHVCHGSVCVAPKIKFWRKCKTGRSVKVMAAMLHKIKLQVFDWFKTALHLLLSVYAQEVLTCSSWNIDSLQCLEGVMKHFSK